LRVGKVLRRFLPGFVVQWIYFARCGALVSPRAEVEISGKAQLGRGTVISSYTKVKIAGPFVTGQRVQIASNCFVEVGEGGLQMGDDVLVGPGCAIITTNYKYDKVGVPLAQQGTVSRGIRIDDRAWIGANVTILDGVHVGRDAIVTAGAVVSSDVPERAIVQGNPARPIFTRR